MPASLSSVYRAVLLTGICLFGSMAAQAQPNYPRTPEEAELVTSDLEHFVEAYLALQSDPDTLGVLQALYFDRGSAGLNEFIARHQLTPELLTEALQKAPERYALLPGFLAEIATVRDSYAQLTRRFGQVLPTAMYAPTYLLVGANRGIGQASLVGQLITVTQLADDLDLLQVMMAHELTHFQQAMAMGGQKYVQLYSDPNNMLGLCLREGGAEFVTSLVLGGITQQKALAYIDADEDRLKQKFLKDLEAQQKEYWLWGSIGQQDYPKLLGYAMGYKICHQYYEQAPDKAAALQDVLRMDDAAAFLASSGYFDRIP